MSSTYTVAKDLLSCLSLNNRQINVTYSSQETRI
jgi:hypothetical protein